MKAILMRKEDREALKEFNLLDKTTQKAAIIESNEYLEQFNHKPVKESANFKLNERADCVSIYDKCVKNKATPVQMIQSIRMAFAFNESIGKRSADKRYCALNNTDNCSGQKAYENDVYNKHNIKLAPLKKTEDAGHALFESEGFDAVLQKMSLIHI